MRRREPIVNYCIVLVGHGSGIPSSELRKECVCVCLSQKLPSLDDSFDSFDFLFPFCQTRSLFRIRAVLFCFPPFCSQSERFSSATTTTDPRDHRPSDATTGDATRRRAERRRPIDDRPIDDRPTRRAMASCSPEDTASTLPHSPRGVRHVSVKPGTL